MCPQDSGGSLPADGDRCTNCGHYPAAPVSNHLALAVIAIFFFFPLGIAALVQSLKVDSCIGAGDYIQAKACSVKAKKYALIGIVASVTICVLINAFAFITYFSMVSVH